MVSHIHYIFNANEDFIIFLTFKFIICFIDIHLHTFNFTKSNELLTYQGEVNMHIKFWAFKVKCTQYGICGQTTFKNARANILLELGKACNNYMLHSNINKILAGPPRGAKTPSPHDEVMARLARALVAAVCITVTLS